VKKGYYLTQWNHQKVPRYQCRACKKKFSSHTFYRTYKQKKPYLNEPIFQLYCSATTQRRIAKLLKINFKTVVRKFLFLAKNAESEHLERLSKRSFDVSSVQFDEMLSFEHTRLKPLSIALAVQKKGHKVIDIQVAECHYQGRLSAIALSKYGPRLDKSNEARKKVLETLQSQVQKTCHIITDAKPQYKSEASRYVPLAQLHQINNRGGRLRRLLQSRRRNIKDPMFELNLVAAKIRHNLSRMARKVWVTTKKAERLQKHLLLFIAYHNEYSVAS
jgi:hypothetical protein